MTENLGVMIQDTDPYLVQPRLGGLDTDTDPST